MLESNRTDTVNISSALQVTGLILVAVVIEICLVWCFGEPYHRGFFCDDESIKYPFRDSHVPDELFYSFGMLVAAALIVLTETLQSLTTDRNEKHLAICNLEIPNWMTFSYQQLGVFGFGAACCEMATAIGKYTIGRPRPYFLTVCRPIMPGNTTCDNPINQGRYIEDFTCGPLVAGEWEEMRLSFPSGHASFSLYTMVYCVIYLQARMTWSLAKLSKHVIQFALFVLAFYTCLTRISDYKHHPSDLVGGSILGTTVAIVVATVVSDLFSARRENNLAEKQGAAV